MITPSRVLFCTPKRLILLTPRPQPPTDEKKITPAEAHPPTPTPHLLMPTHPPRLFFVSRPPDHPTTCAAGPPPPSAPPTTTPAHQNHLPTVDPGRQPPPCTPPAADPGRQPTVVLPCLLPKHSDALLPLPRRPSGQHQAIHHWIQALHHPPSLFPRRSLHPQVRGVVGGLCSSSVVRRAGGQILQPPPIC